MWPAEREHDPEKVADFSDQIMLKSRNFGAPFDWPENCAIPALAATDKSSVLC